MLPNYGRNCTELKTYLHYCRLHFFPSRQGKRTSVDPLQHKRFQTFFPTCSWKGLHGQHRKRIITLPLDFRGAHELFLFAGIRLQLAILHCCRDLQCRWRCAWTVGYLWSAEGSHRFQTSFRPMFYHNLICGDLVDFWLWPRPFRSRPTGRRSLSLLYLSLFLSVAGSNRFELCAPKPTHYVLKCLPMNREDVWVGAPCA